MIRFLDFILSLAGLIILTPVFIMISLLIVAGSPGGAFYLQWRVGKNNRDFRLIKFRTMVAGAEHKGALTVGNRDSRITGTGYYLRKYKLDELPQLINVLLGEMSLVGPRPELRQYTERYDQDQKIVLTVKPGITDYATIEYINENEILVNSDDWERTYIEEVMPAKIALNMRYIRNRTVGEYFRILWLTILNIT
jgi:lipopolysaccharide/colanic/teichoic acid biosynthesis glycosyltransferase